MGHLYLPDPFEVRAWPGPDDADNLDPTGSYSEMFWLPHLGPSTWLLARRVLLLPGPWDKRLLATALGIGAVGLNSTLERSLERLVKFRLAAAVDDRLLVRVRWPRLPERLLAKLPEEFQTAEEGLAAA